MAVMSELRVAFKEWAVICRALAEGRQALVLRKGGISEDGGEFRLEHTRFWLFPAYAHQQRAGVVEEAGPLLAQAEAERPPEGRVRLTHFAEVSGIYHVRDLAAAWKLAPLHCWSQDTVAARFRYRSPGLYVLPLRVYRAAQAWELPEAPHYAGCKSWVELERGLPAEGATPALTEEAFDDVLRALDRILEPTAWV
jgi:hypothetical protein